MGRERENRAGDTLFLIELIFFSDFLEPMGYLFGLFLTPQLTFGIG